MKNGIQFLLTLFAWILFAMGGFTFLRLEGENSAAELRQPEQRTVASALYTGTGDLKRISGEQVLGMILRRSRGTIFYISTAWLLMKLQTLQQLIYVECRMRLIS